MLREGLSPDTRGRSQDRGRHGVGLHLRILVKWCVMLGTVREIHTVHSKDKMEAR